MTLCSTLHPTMTLCSQGPECDCDGFVEFLSAVLVIVNLLPLLAIVYLVASTVADLCAPARQDPLPSPHPQARPQNPTPKLIIQTRIAQTCPGTPRSGRSGKPRRPRCCLTRRLALNLPRCPGMAPR